MYTVPCASYGGMGGSGGYIFHFSLTSALDGGG